MVTCLLLSGLSSHDYYRSSREQCAWKRRLSKKQTNIFLPVPFLTTQVMCVHITALRITHTQYSFHSNTKANGSFKHTEKDKPVNASAFVSGEEIKEKEKGDLGFTIIQGATM